MAIPQDAIERQRRASRPQTSAWVSANAGSGKTHVLTRRVIRLLLEGVPPARILCLTFTKAAAANMSIKVFETLSGWTRLDDAALTEAIEEIGAPRPTGTDRDAARKLFARTVETPGGLKIQTIHAFCERLLHLFPFEANVAARFQVMDDLMQQDLLGRARLDTLRDATAEETGPLSRAIAVIATVTTAASFETLLSEMLTHRGVVRDGMSRRAIAAALGVDEADTAVDIEGRMIADGLPADTWGSIGRQLGADGGLKNTIGNRLASAALAPSDMVLEAYLSVFLTQKLEPRADSYIPAAMRRAQPDLAAQLDSERGRLVALLGRLRAAQVLERTAALTTVTRAILARYETAKRLRGLLDFDDLIERTLTLLQRAGSAWVLYKLDSGIDHVLVDEAQDTSPHQWDILRAITADFFAGAGAARGPRTFFAVGDEKQSIFSFQGARPAMFDEMRRAFERDIKRGGAAFDSVPLTLSFRSNRAILETVDRVFAAADNATGLTAPGQPLLPHEPLRQRAPGAVELWPLIRPVPQPEPRDWRLPLDQVDAQAPPVLLARRIADVIAGWTRPASTETVEDRSADCRRSIRPGDIMILVRSRNAFFDAMIRALKDKGVPVAGADRLQLTEHIAVLDLIAAGRAALLPEDDLTLACVLKSPLIGLDDDDLIALAPTRRGSLAEALAASDIPRHRSAAERLGSWRQRAAGDTPFAFYTRLLGAEGGRRAVQERLGPEAGDALDEFVALTLAHEREGAPSLLAFLARLEGQDLSIKRDMEAAGDAVRVMTVHAAKGLEAKIVVLPDTCGAPSGQHDPKLFALASSNTIAWSPRRDDDPPAVAAARATMRQAALEEHRRLLYVALTRAEERLVVAGFHGTRGKAAGCWYDMIASSDLGLVEAPSPWDPSDVILRRRDPGLDAPARHVEPWVEPAGLTPAWLTQAPPREIAYAPPIKPSTALGAADQTPLEPDGYTPSRDQARRNGALAGQLTHRLLQHLPNLPEDQRHAAAARFLATQGTGLLPDRRATLAAEVLSLLHQSKLAPLFGPTSRAEVGIAGRIKTPGGREIEITGQIDRIATTDAAILIADFKTGQPHDLGTVPAAYVTQLALYRAAVGPLYPGKAVRAFLIWTAGPVVLELPSSRLDEALDEVAQP